MKRNRKKGATALPALIFGVVVLFMGYFLMVDTPLKLTLTNQAIHTLDNAAHAAVTQIDEDLWKNSDVLQIDPDRATQAAYEMIASTYRLSWNPTTNQLTLLEGSPLAEVPTIEVRVVEKPNGAPVDWSQTVTLVNGKDYTAKESTVYVYGRFVFRTLTLKEHSRLVVNRIAAAEVVEYR